MNEYRLWPSPRLGRYRFTMEPKDWPGVSYGIYRDSHPPTAFQTNPNLPSHRQHLGHAIFLEKSPLISSDMVRSICRSTCIRDFLQLSGGPTPSICPLPRSHSGTLLQCHVSYDPDLEHFAAQNGGSDRRMFRPLVGRVECFLIILYTVASTATVASFSIAVDLH